MTTAYINEHGVRPWESAHPTNDAKFTTTTLLSHNFDSVWRSWCSVIEQLSENWSIKREWHSALTAEFNSKTEEYLFKKDAIKKLKNRDIFKKNENSNIYSTIKNLPSDPEKIDNQIFEGSHNVILIVQKTEIAIEDLWSKMTIFEKHINAEKISTFLESQSDVLICRFYEAETHAAAQLIYHTNIENQKIIEASKMRFRKIGIEDVHFYINNE
ncbi:hypothetical protein [Pseudomonas sp.]|uniref:hypothetical protein n=1 Tax=Pseudomonas sp. TaxID=306 RepID=UPI0028A8F636|nr:hypothetical protein [Pseudomonas sp.]